MCPQSSLAILYSSILPYLGGDVQLEMVIPKQVHVTVVFEVVDLLIKIQISGSGLGS